MRRSSSNSTTWFVILYGRPNSFMSAPKVAPWDNRSGPSVTSWTDPDPSIRVCCRGSAIMANTTSVDASIVVLSVTSFSVIWTTLEAEPVCGRTGSSAGRICLKMDKLRQPANREAAGEFSAEVARSGQPDPTIHADERMRHAVGQPGQPGQDHDTGLAPLCHRDGVAPGNVDIDRGWSDRGSLTRPLGCDHDSHREYDDPAADHDRNGDRLAEDQPAEEHRDNRVHVRIGGDQRDRHVGQQPDVGGESEDRPEQNQVRKRYPGPGTVVPGEPLTGDETDADHDQATGEHLVDRHHEHVLGQPKPG